ncbi:MAG TPA: anthranilate phosphoribosyltransferase [Fimbriimonadaceae bacterium]|nr:anthranilate phosphoribosyltransferase [Fimbriimonadaceae bacterium]
MSFLALVQPLLDGSDLTSNQAADLMGWLLDGQATESQIGAVITALKIKGVTAGELAAFAQELRKRARILYLAEDVVDTCGTGGGGSTFNISTAAAFVAAGAGVKIAKHGNRSVTSKCGSADVLEALGAKLQDDLQKLEATFRASGIVFMFAPVHHPGMRHVGKSRKELGFRSVFNQLGPLANPAGAKRQMIGVYSSGLVEPMAKALGLLGVERAVVLHGDDGLDELSPCEKSKAAFVMGSEVRLTTIGPAEFGLEPIDRSALECGETAEQNAQILREAISDSNSPRCQALLPSSAMAIWLSGLPNDLVEARDMALIAVNSGRALESLEKFVEATNRV